MGVLDPWLTALGSTALPVLLSRLSHGFSSFLQAEIRPQIACARLNASHVLPLHSDRSVRIVNID